MTEGIIRVKFKPLHPDARIPKAWSKDAIGVDLHAFLLTEEGRPNTAMIPPNATRNIPTGLGIEPPSGYFLMVCSRSGLAHASLFVANSPGIIDPDYRGEIRVLLYNGSHMAMYVKHEERIAQLIAVPATHLDGVAVTELSKTERGELGLGSTGL